MKPSTAPEGTQSIVRALGVLKMFDDDNPTWDLQDLTTATGLNKSTLHRILGALEHEGLLERRDDARYYLGSEMIALGGRAARVNNLRTVSHPILHKLTNATGETTTLEVLRPDTGQGWYMLVIDEVLGKHLVGITQYIGSRLPVHTTSTGKAILAFTDADTKKNVITAAKGQLSDYIEQELTTIRDQRYTIAYGELEAGLVAIGAPIFDANDEVRAAISLTGPSVRIKQSDLAALAEHVHAHAAQISHQLGYRP